MKSWLKIYMKACRTSENKSPRAEGIRRVWRGLFPAHAAHGFTLVELLLSIIVLSVLIVGSAAMLSYVRMGVKQQEIKRLALIEANEIQERYWNRSYEELVILAGETVETSVSLNGVEHASSVSVGDVVEDGSWGRYVDLGVSVEYRSGQSVSLRSRRYENGLSKARVSP